MVYLIHLSKPLANSTHYIGYSDDAKFTARIRHHQKGSGSHFLRVVNEAGIQWKVVRTWQGKDRSFERWLKNKKKASCLCPECNPKGYLKCGEVRTRAKQTEAILSPIVAI